MKWLKTLIKWWNDDQQRAWNRINKSYERGYNYAAGALLRGEKTAYQLEVESDTPSEWQTEDGRAFDKGIIAAVDKLTSLGVVEDDRLNANGIPYKDEKKSSSHGSAQAVRGRPSLRVVQTLVGEENVPT
jgi:hypothetical protein